MEELEVSDSSGRNTKGNNHLRSQYVLIRSVAQSCLTLCDPMDCSPTGSSVRGIFQARMLEWITISFSIDFFFFFNRHLGEYSDLKLGKNLKNFKNMNLGTWDYILSRQSERMLEKNFQTQGILEERIY